MVTAAEYLGITNVKVTAVVSYNIFFQIIHLISASVKNLNCFKG